MSLYSPIMHKMSLGKILTNNIVTLLFVSDFELAPSPLFSFEDIALWKFKTLPQGESLYKVDL